MKEKLKVTPESLYEELHKIDAIADLEQLYGIWYVENSINEYSSSMTACWPNLKQACVGLWKCADWFRENGTGTIGFREFGVNGKHVDVYSASTCGEFGRLWI